MQISFILSAATLLGAAIATPAPKEMGVQVTQRDGKTVVREVPRALLNARACTNCVHVGDECTIGEGNCYATEQASCTVCGDKSICVSDAGNCDFP